VTAVDVALTTFKVEVASFPDVCLGDRGLGLKIEEERENP